MTDINRLIASIKRRSAHAKEYGDDITFVKLEDLDALVEALEKAQTERDEFRNRLKLERSILEDADKRIAEMESRTVTVKLPQRLQPGADGWDDWYVHSDDEGEYLKFDDVLAMLTAAGIKWEAE